MNLDFQWLIPITISPIDLGKIFTRVLLLVFPAVFCKEHLLLFFTAGQAGFSLPDKLDSGTKVLCLNDSKPLSPSESLALHRVTQRVAYEFVRDTILVPLPNALRVVRTDVVVDRVLFRDLRA